MSEREAGYSLLELVIVLVVIAVLAGGVAVNLGPALVSLDIEQVATRVRATLSRVRREALRGNPNTKPFEFNSEAMTRSFSLENALETNHPGIALSASAPESESDCQGGCSEGERLLCVSGRPFCYSEAANFTFEQSSGRLARGQAIFILSKSRKLVVLVSPEGKTETAELINGRWRAATELEQIMAPVER
jgi:prepilin-type N-terminal cleavage/methylation domain-containing protein